MALEENEQVWKISGQVKEKAVGNSTEGKVALSAGPSMELFCPEIS